MVRRSIATTASGFSTMLALFKNAAQLLVSGSDADEESYSHWEAETTVVCIVIGIIHPSKTKVEFWIHYRH